MYTKLGRQGEAQLNNDQLVKLLPYVKLRITSSEALRKITVESLKDFLIKNGWKSLRDGYRGLASIWGYGADKREEILVPNDSTIADYPQRVGEIIEVLADQLNTNELDIYVQIMGDEINKGELYKDDMYKVENKNTESSIMSIVLDEVYVLTGKWNDENTFIINAFTDFELANLWLNALVSKDNGCDYRLSSFKSNPSLQELEEYD
jgi:hypothetical protein